MPRPSLYPEWADGGSAGIVEPSGAKKLLGWIVEKPPYQFFNWWMNLVYLWIVQLATESTSNSTAISTETTNRSNADGVLLNQILAGFDGIVGAASYCTDADIAAAITRLSAGARILVLDSFALAASVTMSKANMEIILKPGVVISAGVATTGFSITADGCTIRGGKISGFTNGIDVGVGGTNFMARDIRFASNTTDINDPNSYASIVGCV